MTLLRTKRYVMTWSRKYITIEPEHSIMFLQEPNNDYSKGCFTKEEIFSELDLMKNIRIIYSKYNWGDGQEVKFRREVIYRTIDLSDPKKSNLIQQYVDLNLDFFSSP